MICWLMFLGRIPEDHGIETTAAPGEKHFRTGTLLCLIHSTNGTTQFAKDARILVCAAHVGSSYHHWVCGFRIRFCFSLHLQFKCIINARLYANSGTLGKACKNSIPLYRRWAGINFSRSIPRVNFKNNWRFLACLNYYVLNTLSIEIKKITTENFNT